MDISTPLWHVYLCGDTRGPAVNWKDWRDYYQGESESDMWEACSKAVMLFEWQGPYLAVFIDKWGDRYRSIYVYS